jgi:hypothetical protein
MSKPQTVAIIGAGPVGLAAAARVLERGMAPIVLEAGPEAAHSVRQWKHVQLFSPWEYNIDQAAQRLLGAIGWNSPDPRAYPTGGELIEQYLEPLATKTVLRDAIRTSSRVTVVSRVGFDKAKTRGREHASFEIGYQNGKGPEVLRADAVIDVSGTWFSPNPAGSNGLRAIGELEASGRIAYGMPDVRGGDRDRYAGKTVAVLGAGHSAIGTLIDLAHPTEEASGTTPVWLLRGGDPAKAFGGGRNDKLAARGELGTVFAALVAGGEIRVETQIGVTQPGASLHHAGLRGEKGATVSVPVVALDDFFAEDERVSVLKVDVEDAELGVFNGAERILRQDAPLLVFECENRHLDGGSVHDIFSYLETFGYRGSFVSQGRLHSISSFSDAIHQRQDGPGFWKQSGYCNNFIFAKT